MTATDVVGSGSGANDGKNGDMIVPTAEEVSWLVERLKAPMNAGMFLNKDDLIRELFLHRSEAADTLTALSLQLAAVEKVRDDVRETLRARNKTLDYITERMETAEASLTLAQEENERLRKALVFYRDQWEQEVDAEQTGAGWTGSIGDVIPTVALCEDKGTIARATLSTPSKGKDKADAT